jgi:hypothetical protein
MGTITVVENAVNYVFTPDSVKPDSIVYAYSGSTLALPKTLLVRRVYPKKTGTYPGNARSSTKLTWNVSDPAGGVAPIITELTMSWRADLDIVDVTLARKILAQAILDTELGNFYETLQLPT